MAWNDERDTNDHVLFGNADKASSTLLEQPDGTLPLSLRDSVPK